MEQQNGLNYDSFAQGVGAPLSGPAMEPAAMHSVLNPERRRWIKKAEKAAKDAKATQMLFAVVEFALRDAVVCSSTWGLGRRNTKRSAVLVADTQVVARRVLSDKHGHVDVNAYNRFLSIVERGEAGPFSGKDYEIIVKVVNAYRKRGLSGGDTGSYFSSQKHCRVPAHEAPPVPKVKPLGFEKVFASFGWNVEGSKAKYVGRP